jgi:hypothetical protein
MVAITVSDELKAALLANGDRFEVRDQGGLVLFVGKAEWPELPDHLPGMEGLPTSWTTEELDRRRREEKSYTTAEVLEHLRGLTKCS